MKVNIEPFNYNNLLEDFKFIKSFLKTAKNV